MASSTVDICSRAILRSLVWKTKYSAYLTNYICLIITFIQHLHDSNQATLFVIQTHYNVEAYIILESKLKVLTERTWRPSLCLQSWKREVSGPLRLPSHYGKTQMFIFGSTLMDIDSWSHLPQTSSELVTYTLKLLLLSNSRDVGEVECGWRRKDVLEILWARLFETVKRWIDEIFSEALIIQAFSRKLHCLVFRKCHTDDLPKHLLPIQVAHGWSKIKMKNVLI